MTSRTKLDLKNLEKLQSKQRTIIRKAVKVRSVEIKRRMKANAHKISGALRTSIADKVAVNKQGVSAVVGVKNRYSKVHKGVEKVPNRYALVQEDANRFISRSADKNDIEKIRGDIQTEIDAILKG